MANIADDKLTLELLEGKNEVLFRVNNAGGAWRLLTILTTTRED